MENELILLIETNQYTGNFDRELMAYVFGYDKDGYANDEMEIFEREMGENNKHMFYDYLDTTAFGDFDENYSCYEIYELNNLYICLKKQLPKNIEEIMNKRLLSFCDYYNNKNKEMLNIIDVKYFQNKLIEVNDNENIA